MNAALRTWIQVEASVVGLLAYGAGGGPKPIRVQSVLRGPDQASCLQQAILDGERAAQNGYRPVWQGWGQEGGQVTLTILYDLIPTTQAAPPAIAAPISPTPPPAVNPMPAPSNYPASAPTSTPTSTPPTTPPLSQAAAQPTISNRIVGGIVSVVVIVVVALIYGWLNRNL